MNIGENIRRVRKSKGLTMKQLGEKINMSEQAISQYERNLRTPNTKLLFKIANILEIPPENLDPSIKEMANVLEKFDNEINFNSLKEDEKITSAIEILLNHKGYKLSDFTEEEYQQIEKLLLEIIDLIAYKLNHK
ncbi:MerR family transcriptional regulator [Clostridium sporogenes]|nr:helix-turn-helix transcriptional regulator [Clostridium sporogenes]SUY60555.1 MerR family transcriptional regulator [Clostridium sporogenes]